MARKVNISRRKKYKGRGPSGKSKDSKVRKLIRLAKLRARRKRHSLFKKK